MARNNRRATSHLVAAAIVVFASGCAAPLRSIDHARTRFASGDLQSAEQTLRELAEEHGRFADSAALDLAIVEMAQGDLAAAQSRLRTLRDRFDNQPELAISSEAVSAVTDDTARMYRPAGYEQVMIRAMLAVCSLAGDATDAESYALQATMKQDQLRRRAENRGIITADQSHQMLALAPYLRGILREATHHDYDDAEEAYRLVSSVRPQFAPAGEDIARASEGTHSRPGNGVLYVIACVGRGPQLRETTAPTTSTALSIASAMLNAGTNESDSNDRGDAPLALPNIAEVKVPTVVIPPSDVATIAVRLDGHVLGTTHTLSDVGELATNQLESEMPWIMARAILRRATKETAVATVGNTLGLSGTGGSLFHFAAASAWALSESADTRCWGLLPREIQVLRVELPAGTHNIACQSLAFDGSPLHAPRLERVEIVDGRNCYRVLIAPHRQVHLVR